MTELTLEALARRIEAIEKKLAGQELPKKDWRSVVGTCDDDPEFIQQVLAEAEAIRTGERMAASEENPK